MTEYYLWLLQVMGAANPRTHLLLKYFGNPGNVYETALSGDVKIRFSSAEQLRLKSASLEKSFEIMEQCAKDNISIKTLDDADYPFILSNIYNPPAVLFVQGSLKAVNERVCIAGVGSRNPTDYTEKIVKYICTPISDNGTVWVSGLAFGTDKLVHDAALEAGGITAGIMACGFGVDYPKYSTPFRQLIADKGGACISELLPGANPGGSYFKARNRIISGLCTATVIFQAGTKSGTLLTANHAVQQGRILFCVPPHDITQLNIYGGVMPLLRDGAVPVFSPESIVEELRFSYFDTALSMAFSTNYTSDNTKQETSEYEKGVKAKPHGKTNAQEEYNSPPEINQSAPLADLSDYRVEEIGICEYLKSGPRNIEEIIAYFQLDASEISEYLLNLEIGGIIECSAGAYYSLIAEI